VALNIDTVTELVPSDSLQKNVQWTRQLTQGKVIHWWSPWKGFLTP